jgi:hypothetical protein
MITTIVIVALTIVGGWPFAYAWIHSTKVVGIRGGDDAPDHQR